MPGSFDIALVVALLAWGAWDHFVMMPAAKRSIERGEPGARLRMYGVIAASEWALTLAVLAWWLVARRPLPLLGLSLHWGWRLGAGLALAALFAFRTWAQSRALARKPIEKLASYRTKLPAGFEFLLPHTRDERNAFFLLSVTAGVCEELLARGFLMWFIGAWTGPWIAAVLSSALFGLGHAYQGASGVLKTGVVGLVMAFVYLATGSLVPGILLHALIDAGSGDVVQRILEADAQTKGGRLRDAEPAAS